MAEKRMLSRKITENDNFVALPATAQALYMHLTLGADDDGFCDQISVALYRAHAKKKDLDALLNARYLLRFESGVIVIKHWRMANAGRSDRYTPTAYQEEYQQLRIKTNKSYTMATDGHQDGAEPEPNRQPSGNQTTTMRQPDGNQMATNRQPPDNQMTPQKRIEEKRREENIYTARDARAPTRIRAEDQDDGFQAFWAAYPRKSGDIRSAYMEYARVTETTRPEALIAAIKAQTDGVSPEDLHFLPSAEKWLRNRGWLSKASLKSQRPGADKKPAQFMSAADYNSKTPAASIAPKDLAALVDAI